MSRLDRAQSDYFKIPKGKRWFEGNIYELDPSQHVQELRNQVMDRNCFSGELADLINVAYAQVFDLEDTLAQIIEKMNERARNE